jgi:hypothetical protein
LDDEEVGAADRLGVAAVDLAVGERLQAGVDQLDVQAVGDLPAELAARAPGRDHQPLLVAGLDAPRRCRSLGRLEGLAHDESSSVRSA